MPNWRIKAYTQWILSKLPYGERLNHALQAIKLRGPKRSARTLKRIPQVGAALRRLAQQVPLENAEVVEVGTGWVPFVTLLLYLCGTRRIWTFDIVRHCRFQLVKEMLAVLRSHSDQCASSLGVNHEVYEQRLGRIEGASDLEELFKRANIEYAAPADAAVTGLPDASVDIHLSYSVFEYVPVQALNAILAEAARILKPEGRLYAYMGCGDDYATFDKKLNAFYYLKFTDAQWQRRGVSGLYLANRLREQEYIELLQRLGGRVEAVTHTLRDADIEYLRQMQVADRFARLTPEQNAVRITELIASFPGQSASS